MRGLPFLLTPCVKTLMARPTLADGRVPASSHRTQAPVPPLSPKLTLNQRRSLLESGSTPPFRTCIQVSKVCAEKNELGKGVRRLVRGCGRDVRSQADWRRL